MVIADFKETSDYRLYLWINGISRKYLKRNIVKMQKGSFYDIKKLEQGSKEDALISDLHDYVMNIHMNDKELKGKVFLG